MYVNMVLSVIDSSDSVNSGYLAGVVMIKAAIDRKDEQM